MKSKLIVFWVLLLVCVFQSSCVNNTDHGDALFSYEIDDNINTPMSRFAVGELENALQQINKTPSLTGKYTIRLSEDKGALGEQAFKITVEDDLISIVAGDPRGALYGTLDLAEQIRLNGIEGLTNTEQTPFIEKRGIKFNIPLDARLPSYDDTGDAAQNNIAEMWNKDFWHAYLDSLARNRYNVLTLWTKHPFPSLIKLKDYPDVAMDDVYVFDKPITPETEKDWNGIDIQDMANLRLVKKISIDEKIAFWQHVMEYAHNRGIDIYFFTWNAFVTGAEKYGIDPTEESGVAYVRECVKEFVKTYPYVSGIGVTAGERMSWRIAGRSKEKWLYDTYGLGVKDALADQPGREVNFIFRSHGTYLENITKDFSADYPFPVETDYKYSAARMYSSVHPRSFGGSFEAKTKEYNTKSWMNVRNDDIFLYRWGNPDFAREYIKNMGSHYIAGFYMGSDGYVWGREFTSKNPALSGQLEVEKHWYREMMWGRLAYNPDLDKTFFLSVLEEHYPGTDVDALYEVWKASSEIIPAVQSFHFKPADSQWHVEAGVSMYGFASINDFIDSPTVNARQYMTIPEYANGFLRGSLDDRKTPLDVADRLLALSEKTLSDTKKVKLPSANIEEFKDTIADMEAMAYLGAYYAWKIRGAVAFYLYEADDDKAKKAGYQKSAMAHLTKARETWALHSKNAKARYKTQLLARTEYLDWDRIYDYTQQDLAIVEQSTGEKDKLVKVFVHNKNQLNNKEYKPVQAALTKSGFVPEMYPFSHIDSYVDYYTRVVIFSEEDTNKPVKRMKVEGAQIPPDYKSNGYAVVKHKNIYWVMGKDRAHMLKAIDEFIARGTL